MNCTPTSTIVQCLWINCNVLRVDQRRSVEGEVLYGDDTPFGDDVESAVKAGLVRVGRLMKAVLKHAFEGIL